MRLLKIWLGLLCLVAVIACQPANAQAADPSPAAPQIPQSVFSIADYGAVSDGNTLNTTAITKAIAACKAAGGGVVHIPSGQYLTGPFDLTSKMNLHLDEGSSLMFTDSPDAFPISDNRHRHAIAAEACTDIAITGKGTIDGQGNRWWADFLKVKGKPEQKTATRRPNLIDLGNCKRVLVQGVLLRNSPNFHLVPRDCDDVVIDGVRFSAPADAPNTDAMDPSGHNYVIIRCVFDVGDDCIAFKPHRARKDGLPSCQDILVTDCTFKHGHGLSIGGQTAGGIRRLVVRNCTFDGTDAGIRMKASRGQGGLVEDLTYDNITMKNVKVAIFITSYYPNNTTPKQPDKEPPQPVTATTPIWRNIRISNVTASDCDEAGRIIGLAEMPLSDLRLKNVKLSAVKGMQIFNASKVQFEDCEVKAARGEPWTLGNADVTGLARKD